MLQLEPLEEIEHLGAPEDRVPTRPPQPLEGVYPTALQTEWRHFVYYGEESELPESYCHAAGEVRGLRGAG